MSSFSLELYALYYTYIDHKTLKRAAFFYLNKGILIKQLLKHGIKQMVALEIKNEMYSISVICYIVSVESSSLLLHSYFT